MEKIFIAESLCAPETKAAVQISYTVTPVTSSSSVSPVHSSTAEHCAAPRHTRTHRHARRVHTHTRVHTDTQGVCTHTHVCTQTRTGVCAHTRAQTHPGVCTHRHTPPAFSVSSVTSLKGPSCLSSSTAVLNSQRSSQDNVLF